MLIVCPNCATSYMIDQAAVGPAGRTVRCARCRASWFAGGPEPAPAETAAAEAQQARSGRADAPPQATAATAAQAADAGKQGSTQSKSAAATEVKSPPIEPTAIARTRGPGCDRDRAGPSAGRSTDVGVEPVTITDAPPLVPPLEHEAGCGRTPIPKPKTAATFDARRKRMQARRKQSRRSSRWTAIVLVLIAVNVTLIGARNEVVRYLPQTASLFAAIGLPVNLRSLKFENVKISTEDRMTASAILIVQGTIVSETGKPVAVPRLRFAVRNATGQEVYTWTMLPPRSILEPGERLRIPQPDPNAAGRRHAT